MGDRGTLAATWTFALLAGVALSALAAACGTTAAPSPTPTATRPSLAPTSLPRPAPTVAPTGVPVAATARVKPAGTQAPAATRPADGVTDTVLDKLIEKAKQDAALRGGVPVGQITLVSATAVEWRDSSLGCPQPGGMYAQVITPGYRIVLEARGQRYEFHSDSSSRVVYCQNP